MDIIRVFAVVFVLTSVSCKSIKSKSQVTWSVPGQERPPQVYFFDVNKLREPLTNYDIISKSVKYCVHLNNRTLDNNYLLGTWYRIYEFSRSNMADRVEYCPTAIFTAPTEEQLDEYKAKYDIRNETFTFDGAVLCAQLNDKLKGIVTGNKTAKYYFIDTRSSQRLAGIYDVLTYKPINDEYLIYYQCNMRGNVKFLWSKKRNPTDKELEKVLKPLYEVEGMKKLRYCWKKTVVSTTPYF